MHAGLVSLRHRHRNRSKFFYCQWKFLMYGNGKYHLPLVGYVLECDTCLIWNKKDSLFQSISSSLVWRQTNKSQDFMTPHTYAFPSAESCSGSDLMSCKPYSIYLSKSSGHHSNTFISEGRLLLRVFKAAVLITCTLCDGLQFFTLLHINETRMSKFKFDPI